MSVEVPMATEAKRGPGRPRKKVEDLSDPTQPLSIRIPVWLRQELEVMADRDGRSMANTISYLVKKAFEANESALRLADSEALAHFKVRMPLQLHQRLESAAADARRSMGMELIFRLERTFALDVTPISLDDLTLAQAKALQAELTAVLAGGAAPDKISREVKP